MILIEMFEEIMGHEFLQNFLPQRPRGGETQTKENFELLQLRTLGRYIQIFLAKVRVLVMTIFRKLKKIF